MEKGRLEGTMGKFCDFISEKGCLEGTSEWPVPSNGPPCTFYNIIDKSCMKFFLLNLGIFQLECCGGTHGPQDWENNIYFNCTSVILVNGIKYQPAESCGVPFSCCALGDMFGSGTSEDTVVDTQCGYGVRQEKAVS